MSDDEKDDDKRLPVIRTPPAVPTSRGPAYPQSPVQHRSLAGRLWSRFVSTMNTKTIDANRVEVQALTNYADARGALAQAMLRADRAVFDYVEHRDDYLREDHADFLNSMEEKEHQRELDRRRRAATLRALDADATQSAMQREYDHKIAVETNEAALAEAQWKAAHAQWGRDAFQQTLGFRRERLDHLYKTGAIEKEIDRLISESLRDEQLAAHNRSAGLAPQHGNVVSSIAVLEQWLGELDQELEIAHATHASDDHKAALYALRSRLSAKIDAIRRDATSGPAP